MPEPDVEQPCPIECPNRKLEGICLFGHSIDPVELLVQFAIVIILLVPASRRSTSETFNWQEGMGWFGAIAVASAIVRLAPTDRLNAYKQIVGK